jgi:hypothetical protein
MRRRKDNDGKVEEEDTMVNVDNELVVTQQVVTVDEVVTEVHKG